MMMRSRLTRWRALLASAALGATLAGLSGCHDGYYLGSFGYGYSSYGHHGHLGHGHHGYRHHGYGHHGFGHGGHHGHGHCGRY